MSRWLVVVFLVVTSFVNPSFALKVGPAKIEGVVKSYNESEVVLENEKATYRVPRDMVKKTLKAGEKVTVSLSNEDLPKVKVFKKK